MNIKTYLKEKGIRIFFFMCVYAMAGAFMGAAGVSLPVICITEITFFLTGCGDMLYDYAKRVRYYREMRDTIHAFSKMTSLLEIPPEPRFWDGLVMHSLLEELRNNFNDQMAGQIRSNREYRQYIETWVHEIKLPIAAAQLLIANHPGQETASIEEELKKIEAYVQQVLYYARSEGVEKDYLISAVSLKELVLKELSDHAREMLEANVRPAVENLDYQILADSKWCGFILRQIISNSIKYRSRKDAVVSFTAKEKGERIWLVIADNGAGIPEQDLERVFEKGFTGENGREYGASTGMGLYLCKKLCDKMEMELRIQSVRGKGTQVMIGFQKA
ncbi:sensor histidine kinase [Anaerovorax odorimutans]|uniref:histidine kinase n=1 Tax=Anaerovorax odorimutans TaxID=109327 RepID=A0ABT1RL63_9FIRM|nr:sensor histidine kinase [Anaerovorax odorimutans]MCQ4635924.1 sensor histidine kinase [Anaerovorax odorimutans]